MRKIRSNFLTKHSVNSSMEQVETMFHSLNGWVKLNQRMITLPVSWEATQSETLSHLLQTTTQTKQVEWLTLAIFTHLKRLINESSAENLPKDGSESMQGNIDVNNHEILNLKEARPHYSFHAVNVNFVSKTISDNNATITAVYVSYVNTAKAELQELTKSLTDSLSRKSETCISALLLTRKMVLLMSSPSPIIGLSRSYPAFPNS